MIESRIDHVGLNVTSLEESISFYAELFHFEVMENWTDPKQAFVGRGDVVPGLIEAPEYDFRAYTKAHIAFPCKPEAFADIVEVVRNLVLEVVSGPKPQRGGESILFRGPSGNILEVCYPALTASRNEA